MKPVLALAAALFAIPVLHADAALSGAVHIDSGAIEGVPALTPNVTAFEGIPYAAPPVGDLRWKEPQPVTPWKAVRQAVEFGAECTQSPYAEGSLYYSPP